MDAMRAFQLLKQLWGSCGLAHTGSGIWDYKFNTDERRIFNNSKWMNPNTSGVNHEVKPVLFYTALPRLCTTVDPPSVNPVLPDSSSVSSNVQCIRHMNWHLSGWLKLLSRLTLKCKHKVIWYKREQSKDWNIWINLPKEAIWQKLHCLSHKSMLAWKYNGCFYWLVNNARKLFLAVTEYQPQCKELLSWALLWAENIDQIQSCFVSFPKWFLHLPCITGDSGTGSLGKNTRCLVDFWKN